MYENVLIAYDASDPARHAVQAALEATQGSATCRFHLVEVMPSMQQAYAFSDISNDPASPLNAYEDPALVEEAERNVRERQLAAMKNGMGDLADKLPADRTTYDVEFAPNPAIGLLTYCDEKGCDLIVMGNRGLGALRGMLGSVSFSVLRSAAVPVLIVK